MGDGRSNLLVVSFFSCRELKLGDIELKEHDIITIDGSTWRGVPGDSGTTLRHRGRGLPDRARVGRQDAEAQGQSTILFNTHNNRAVSVCFLCISPAKKKQKVQIRVHCSPKVDRSFRCSLEI